MRELFARISDYFKFDKQEIFQILTVILIMGFIFSFRDWGAETIDPGVGFYHFFLAIILAAIAIFLRVAVQKIVGLSMGFQSTFVLWWTGIVISLVLIFISNGYLPIILPGGIAMTMMVRHRLGEFRYGFNYWEQGLTAYSGSVGNIILALLFKVGLLISPNNWFLQKGMLVNIIIALCLLLPIPKLDGLHLLYTSRMWYFFLYGIIIGVSILIFFANILFTVIGGIAIGGIIWLLFYLIYERRT